MRRGRDARSAWPWVVVERLGLDWRAFQQRLIAAIAAHPEAPYYDCWVAALERLVLDYGAATAEEMEAARETVRAETAVGDSAGYAARCPTAMSRPPGAITTAPSTRWPGLRAHRHYLDWDIKPLPFKIYPRSNRLRCHVSCRRRACRRWRRLRRLRQHAASRASVDLTTLARLLHFSAGITRKKVYPDGQEHYFRAAACTGALYHIDLYVICGDLPGLGGRRLSLRPAQLRAASAACG